MSKVGRNDPCPCGSGRKYKKCCLKKDRRKRHARREDNRDEKTQGSSAPPLTEVEREDVPAPEPAYSPPESPYPQVDQSLPDLPPEKEEIVEGWWDEFMPAFEREEVEEMIRRIEAFMEEHPDLFVHLGLEEACLFELGGMLGRRGEHSRYAELLMRIRREHPEMYVRAFGHYDLQVIAELILRGEQERVPEYFDFFREYPDSNPDELRSVVNLLAATNCQQQLFELARATAIPCIQSPVVMGGNFVFNWYSFEQWIPFLEADDPSPEAVEEHIERLRDMELPFEIEFNEEKVRRLAASVFEEPSAEEQMALRTEEEFNQFCGEMCSNFMLFLHRRRGMSWATARHFADALESYLLDRADHFSPGKPLNFHQDPLDEHLSSRQRLFALDGIQAMSALQAVHEFVPYLEEKALRTTPEPAEIPKICHNLHELCVNSLAGDDPARRVFADFPEYRWSD
jgi:hypothetical protein